MSVIVTTQIDSTSSQPIEQLSTNQAANIYIDDVSPTAASAIGTSVATAGISTAANQTAQSALFGAVNETAPATDTASSGLNGRAQRIAQRITSLIALLPAAIGRTTGAGSLSVIDAASSTATTANVASSATSVTLMASNTSRIAFVIYNDSTSILYVKFGTTASATSFTYLVNPGDTLDIPITRYTGIIDGIWSSANGFARVTEI